MKALNYLILMCLFLFSTGYTNKTIANGQSESRFGDFVIEKSDRPLISNARILRTYEIRYENSDMIFRVAIDDSDKKCIKYLAVTDNFAVEYWCIGKRFGVNKISNSYVEDGMPSTNEKLNRSEYFRQKVLTNVSKSEIDNVKLISVFFPRLISNDILAVNN